MTALTDARDAEGVEPLPKDERMQWRAARSDADARSSAREQVPRPTGFSRSRPASAGQRAVARAVTLSRARVEELVAASFADGRMSSPPRSVGRWPPGRPEARKTSLL